MLKYPPEAPTKTPVTLSKKPERRFWGWGYLRDVIAEDEMRKVQALLACSLFAANPAAAQSNDPDTGTGTLEPTYQPRPPPEKETYTTDYLFAITRAIADSTIAPAGRVPLYFLSIPVDIVFLPIELIAGFFPSD